MDLFTSRDKRQKSELERVLHSLPLSEIELSYDGYRDARLEKAHSKVYVLRINDSLDAYIPLGENQLTISIGLSYKSLFFSTTYGLRITIPTENLEVLEHVVNLQNLQKEKKHKSKIYLPLQLSNFVVSLSDSNDIPLIGTPFPAMGIEGSQGVYPLLLVHTSISNKNRGYGIDLQDKSIKLYKHTLAPTEMRSVMQSLQRKTNRSTDQTKTGEITIEGAVKEDGEKRVESAENASQRIVVVPWQIKNSPTDQEINWREPTSIVSYLDEYVVGQRDAKRLIAVAFSNYMTKVQTKNEDIYKENVLLIGPSGVGKTYMISLLAKKAALPMVQTKLTGKSNEGYKGENLSTVFEQMRAMTKEEAPYGVIFLDEIDKLARDESGSGNAFGPRLQDELIGWLEDATIMVETKKENKPLNTRNILFVTAGAFGHSTKDDGLTEIIQKRLGYGQKIGFGIQQERKDGQEEYVLSKVRPEDLIMYGLKTELVGRLPSLGVLHPLTLEDKVRILTQTKKSVLRNYTQLLSLKGYEVQIGQAVPEVIAGCCPAETGARALHAVCNDFFTKILFEPARYADDKKVIKLTAELARELITLYRGV